MSSDILEMKNITKYYPGVVALNNVNFFAEKGKVTCLVGENGAGKSTLVKILAGIIPKDAGEIYLNGKRCRINSLFDARKAGLSFIFQENNLVNKMTVLENYSLGEEKNFLGVIYDRNTSYKNFIKISSQLNFNIDPNAIVETLSTAEKQMLEIIKAMKSNLTGIVFDEPTTSLSKLEINKLFSLIEKLKKQNIIIIYISHFLDEIFDIGDYVTVLRDGRIVGTRKVSDFNKRELIKMMVGEDIITRPKKRIEPVRKEPLLEVRNLYTERLNNVNFSLYKGEILGVTGLRGSGHEELAEILFGLKRPKKGRIVVDNKEVDLRNPRTAVLEGISFLPEERKERGLFELLSVSDNLSITALVKKFLSRVGIVNKLKKRNLVDEIINKLDIKTPSRDTPVKYLSGGNQQKVLIGRSIGTKSKIIILNEPTHGIDVKSKSEVYNILNNLKKKGTSIVVFSTEYAEIVKESDRIIVFYEGSIIKIIEKREASEEAVLNYVYGGIDECAKQVS